MADLTTNEILSMSEDEMTKLAEEVEKDLQSAEAEAEVTPDADDATDDTPEPADDDESDEAGEGDVAADSEGDDEAESDTDDVPQISETDLLRLQVDSAREEAAAARRHHDELTGKHGQKVKSLRDRIRALETGDRSYEPDPEPAPERAAADPEVDDLRQTVSFLSQQEATRSVLQTVADVAKKMPGIQRYGEEITAYIQGNIGQIEADAKSGNIEMVKATTKRLITEGLMQSIDESRKKAQETNTTNKAALRKQKKLAGSVGGKKPRSGPAPAPKFDESTPLSELEKIGKRLGVDGF